MKRCSQCRKVQESTKFHKHKKCAQGLQPICKKCVQSSTRTKIGRIKQMYSSHRSNSKRMGRPMPNYTKDELIKWCTEQVVYHELHTAWETSNYSKNLTPSCDRINDYKPYTLDNIQLMTWQENDSKGHADRKNGVNNKNSKTVYQYTKRGCLWKCIIL